MFPSSPRPGRTGENLHIQKLIPNVDNDRPGELYERREKRWKLIGYILPEDKASGFVTPVEETP